MAEHDEEQRAEELRRKLESVRQKALADELARLESFAASKVGELVAARRAEEDTLLRELMTQAAARRTAAQSALVELEPKVLGALEAAITIRTDARRREEAAQRAKVEEEAQRRKAEEERQREEAARKKAEEESRLKSEAEQRKAELQKKKAEEEARLRAEAELRKKKEEERLKAEAERKKKDEEHRRQLEADQKRRKEEEDRHKREQEARLKAEEELRRQQEERQRAEEAERLAREEAERQRLRAEEEAREKERKERERQEQLAKAKEREAAAAMSVEPLPEMEPMEEVALPSPGKKKGDKKKGNRKDESAAPGAKRPASDGAAKKTRLPMLVMTVIVAGALLVGAVLFFQLKKSVFPTVTSIAVIPWTAPTSSGDDGLIAASLAEEVAHQMEQAPAPAVLGFGTARKLAHGADPQQAAFGLGFPFVLRGTLARSGESYTINLQLVDSVGDPSWEKSYTRAAEGLSLLPAEIVGEVRAAMRLPATPSGSKPSTNPTAFLLYLKGLGAMAAGTAQDLRDAYALFDQSVGLEPEFSDALAAKAQTIVLAYAAGSPIEGTTLEDAKKLSADAIANSPSSAAGYLARGMAFDQLKQYRMAFQQMENALQRSPNSAEAYLAKARIHLKVGQHEDGMNALTSAYRLSPRDPAILTLIAQTYQFARATKEGFVYHELALQCVPDTTAYIAGPMADAILTDANLTLTQSDRVAAALQRVIDKHPEDYRALYRLARLYQVSGKGLEALNLLGVAEGLIKADLAARPQDGEATATLALILTRQGKFTDAVPLAERTLAANPGNARINYILAQMYALQMYSGKTLTVDEEVKKSCITSIHDALALDFRFEELANGDFYNMYEHGDFASVIQVPLR